MDIQAVAGASRTDDIDGRGEEGAAGAMPPLTEQLLWQPCDAVVRPIVSNRRIERLPELRWEASMLPFAPLVRPSRTYPNGLDVTDRPPHHPCMPVPHEGPHLCHKGVLTTASSKLHHTPPHGPSR